MRVHTEKTGDVNEFSMIHFCDAAEHLGGIGSWRCEKDYGLALIRRIRFGGCNEFNLNRRIRRGVIHSTKTVGGAVPPKKSTMALRTTVASDIGWKNAFNWIKSDLARPKCPRADINLVRVIRVASGRR